jgi:hypothetical protein
MSRALRQNPPAASPFAKARSRLDKAIKIYNHGFFCNSEMQALVQASVSAFGPPPTKVFHSCDDAIARTIAFTRVPVYFGGIATDFFDADAAEDLVKEVRPCTFGVHRETEPIVVGSRVHVFKAPSPHTRAAVASISEEALMGHLNGTIGLVHAYGVNFETKETADYAKYVDAATGEVDFPAVYQRILQTFNLAFAAATDETVGGGEHAHLRMPAIGLGAFAEAIGGRYMDHLVMAYARGLVRALEEYPSLTVEVVVREPHKATFLIRCLSSLAETTRVRLGIRTSDDDGDIANIFSANGAVFPSDPTKPVLLGGKPLVLLNPADMCAWFGNGGRRDRTVDGMCISGLHNMAFRNDGYAANPVISGADMVFQRLDALPTK